VSYVRWGPDSDVYVYDSVRGGTDCCACNLNGGRTYNTTTHAAMIRHLRRHQDAGDQVPDDAIDALAEET